MEEEVLTQHKPAKILVIDDDEGSRSLLRRRLSMHGHEVMAAPDTKEAEKILQNRPVDVIFLGMSAYDDASYEFLVELKQKYPTIPVIVVSSNDDTDLLVKCIEGGAEDYLVRPLNQTILKARLFNCIARKEASDKERVYIEKIKQGQKQIAAQEKMASVGTLVASISQELKSPLNFVINFAGVSADICGELLKKMNEKNVFQDDEQKEIQSQLEKFQSNVAKISEYGSNIDYIIRFMNDQTNTEDDKKSPMNINKTITQIINMLASTYKSKGITNIPFVITELDSNIPHVVLSVQAFSKLIYNLLDNSFYAVNKKFENISSAQVIVTTKDLADTIEIIVKDNGIGIPANLENRIFEPFFTTKEGSINPGLGLSTVLETVQNMNGKISERSIEGEFTEFTISIPKDAH